MSRGGDSSVLIVRRRTDEKVAVFRKMLSQMLNVLLEFLTVNKSQPNMVKATATGDCVTLFIYETQS